MRKKVIFNDLGIWQEDADKTVITVDVLPDWTDTEVICEACRQYMLNFLNIKASILIE